jgi:hypothetical protein
MSTDIQAQKLEMADNEEPPVDLLLDRLPPESRNRMDEFFEKAKQKLQTVEDTYAISKKQVNETYAISKKQVIIELAENISGLPGVDKTRVASFIAYGFKEHNIGVNKSYVYQVLGKEYKDSAISDAARRTRKEMYNTGWDPKSKVHVNADNYDVKYVTAYGRAALENVIRGLDRKVKTLGEKKMGVAHEKDDGSASRLRVENETLKQENAGLKQQNAGLEQIIAGLKEENLGLRKRLEELQQHQVA